MPDRSSSEPTAADRETISRIFDEFAETVRGQSLLALLGENRASHLSKLIGLCAREVAKARTGAREAAARTAEDAYSTRGAIYARGAGDGGYQQACTDIAKAIRAAPNSN